MDLPGSVTLSTSTLSTGVTASFTTNGTAGTSLLTFNIGGTAVAGGYPITINGVSGTISASRRLMLNVTGGGGGFACHVGYAITKGGFALSINNTGTTAISSWSLTWSFANGRRVTQLWNGNVIQSGLANVDGYDGSIAAGGSLTSVGFNGSWNNATHTANLLSHYGTPPP